MQYYLNYIEVLHLLVELVVNILDYSGQMWYDTGR